MRMDMNCKHSRLIRLEGPIHAKDNPPIYQCELCKEMLRVTVAPDEITIKFGTRP